MVLVELGASIVSELIVSGLMGIPFTDLAEAVTVRGCQPIDIRFEG
jgi:hypothetical protein